MAGDDQRLRRRGLAGRRASRVGFLPAGAAARSGEDRARQRRGRRRGDPGAARRASTRSTRSSARSCPPRRWTRSSRSRARSRTGSRPPTAWDLDSRLELAMDALRLPPADADVSNALRRRAAPRRALPAAAEVARPAAARRADQPSRRRVGRLARTLPQGLPGHRRRRHARSLLPRQRRRLDPRARSRLGHSVGRATTRPGSSRSRSGSRSRRSRRPSGSARSQRELEWIRMSPRARQAKGKARLNAYEDLLAEETAQKIEQVEIYIPPGPRLGDVVVEARGLRKGYGDLLLIDDLNFTLPRGGIVGVIGPNGAGKTTLFRMITGQEQPDAGTLRLGETVQVGYVDQSRDALVAGQDRLGGDLRRRDERRARQARGRLARLRVVVQLQGPRSAAEGRRALGRRAQPRAPREAAARAAQPAAARRADQRSRRRHAARARGGAARFRRLRGRHQPRSLVPRPHRDAHARVRRRQPGGVVRGQLPGLRGRRQRRLAPRPTSRTGSSTGS